MQMAQATITYQGKDWPVREIEIDGSMELIATEELERLLISPDGTPKSDEAYRVDNAIYFYAPEHWLEIYDDVQLTALVLQETSKSMINNKCPYCGSADICADIDVRITGILGEDGEIRAKEHWLIRDYLDGEAIACAPSDDIHGFCSSCQQYCDFDWKKGFIMAAEDERSETGHAVKEAGKL